MVAEAYLQPSWTCKMEPFAKMVNLLQAVNFFRKKFHLDVLGSQNASELNVADYFSLRLQLRCFRGLWAWLYMQLVQQF